MKDSFILGTNEIDSELSSPRTQMKRSNILNINDEFRMVKDYEKKAKVNHAMSHFTITKNSKNIKPEGIILSSNNYQKSNTDKHFDNRKKGNRNKNKNNILQFYDSLSFNSSNSQSYLPPSKSNASQIKDTFSVEKTQNPQLYPNFNSNSIIEKNKNLNKKSRLLLMPTTLDRHSIIKHKLTEVDSSYDKYISTSLLSSVPNATWANQIDISPDIKSQFSNGKTYNQLPTLPLPHPHNFPRTFRALSHRSKKKTSSHILLPQKNNIFKYFLRHKGSRNRRKNIENNFNDFNYNKTTNDINTFSDNSDNSRNILNGLSGDDYSHTSDSRTNLAKMNTSKTVLKHWTVHCPKRCKIIQSLKREYSSNTINYFNITRELYIKKFIGKISQLMRTSYVDEIDIKCNKLKQENLHRFCVEIEQQVDCILTRSLTRRNNSKLSVSSQEQRKVMMGTIMKTIQRSNRNNKNSKLSIYNSHYFHTNPRNNTNSLNLKVSPKEMKLLFKAYDDLFYHQILDEYASIGSTMYQSSIITKIINDEVNKQSMNRLLEADFNTTLIDKNKVCNKFSTTKTNKEKTRLNNGLLLFKLNCNNKSIKPLCPKKDNDKIYSLLHDTFYSRGDFDINNLQQMTKNLELLPRCKAKNIKFHIVDEQEEMKMNKNMSKESLVFRTQELKLKIKEKLETIEEILFFLIKEINFKEFKKLFEQFQMPVESRDEDGNTLLIFAVECSFIECIIYLIQKGADINAQNNMLNTPLHIALSFKNFELADVLLKNGADEKVLNKSNLTPWQCLAFE